MIAGDYMRLAIHTDERHGMADTLYTRRQAAERLTISVPTLDRLIRTGELPVVRIGRSVRLAESDLHAYLTRHHTRTGATDAGR
jgi:excisionase family DNA binding protein